LLGISFLQKLIPIRRSCLNQTGRYQGGTSVKIIPSVVKSKRSNYPFASTTMTSLFILTNVLLGQGCLGSKSSSSSVSSASGYIRYYYNSFPRSLRFSDAFSATDITEMTAGSTALNQASDNNYTFFTPSTVPLDETITNYASWKNTSHIDVRFYKASNGNIWPSGLSSYALAVTINWGVYEGSNTIRLTASSIGVNGVGYNFYNESDPATYDAGDYATNYVFTHEAGHAIGLGHVTTGDTSLMESYVSSGYGIDDLQPYASTGKTLDKATEAYIKGNYGISMSSELSDIFTNIVNSASGLMAGLTPEDLIAANIEKGDAIEIQHELNPDGTCVHKLNGKKIKSHKVSMNKLKFEKVKNETKP